MFSSTIAHNCSHVFPPTVLFMGKYGIVFSKPIFFIHSMLWSCCCHIVTCPLYFDICMIYRMSCMTLCRLYDIDCVMYWFYSYVTRCRRRLVSGRNNTHVPPVRGSQTL